MVLYPFLLADNSLGYEYKNSISNGCFFNIAARLAKYTGNSTYIDWAERTYDWMSYIGLIDDRYYVYDGTAVLINCSNVNHLQWSYNAGVLLFGAASLWNITGSDIWYERTQGLLNGTEVFFTNESIMFEVACEQAGTCDTVRYLYLFFSSFVIELYLIS